MHAVDQIGHIKDLGLRPETRPRQQAVPAKRRKNIAQHGGIDDVPGRIKIVDDPNRPQQHGDPFVPPGHFCTLGHIRIGQGDEGLLFWGEGHIAPELGDNILMS